PPLDPAQVEHPVAALRGPAAQLAEDSLHERLPPTTLVPGRRVRVRAAETGRRRAGQAPGGVSGLLTDEVSGFTADEGVEPREEQAAAGVVAEVTQLHQERRPDLLDAVVEVRPGGAMHQGETADDRVVEPVELFPRRARRPGRGSPAQPAFQVVLG